MTGGTRDVARINRRAALLAGLAGFAGVAVPIAQTSRMAYDDPADIYTALRQSGAIQVPVGDRTLRVAFADGASGLNRSLVLSWICASAAALTAYFGRFPVLDYGLLVIAEDGDGVGHATTFGYGGPATRIRVGRSAGRDAFARDWVLAHEMFHAALPDLPRRALWMQEGNATWLEPVARAAAGQLPVSEVWRQAIAGMPTGEPGPGDGGMDGTRTHDRLYWGGATFWLRAEVEILLQSNDRHTLRDAMRRVNRASGGIAADWTPEQLVECCDQETGASAVSKLYERFASRPERTDLESLFARLGVSFDTGKITFDNSADFSGIRQRITSK